MSVAGVGSRLLGLWRSERWAPERLQRHQEAKLRALVDHAYRTVPYYRELLDRAAVHPDEIRTLANLARIPISRRADLQAAQGDALLSRDFAEAPLVEARTSGATGRPFVIRRDQRFEELRKPLFLRALLAAGYRPGERMLLLTVSGDSKVAPGWLGWHYVLSEAPAEELLAALNRIRPTVVYGPVTPLRQIVGLVAAGAPLVGRPRLIVTTAETLDAPLRLLLGRTLGGRISDIYGSTELGTLAYECPARDGYHVAAETTVIQLEPVPGSGLGRVVATNLELRSMPMIRYDTGDLARLGSAARCACGRTSPRLAGIEGRLVDCVRLASGELVSPYRLTLAVEEIAGVERYQIIQEAIDRYTVRIVGGSADRAQVPGAVREALRRVVGSAATIEVGLVADLDPPLGRKFRVVECRLPGLPSA